MSVTKDGDTGRWMSQIRVTDWTGKTIHKKKRGFATKKEALQWERDFISQSTGSLGMTFGDFIALYVKDMEHRLKPSTVASKKWLIDLKVTPFFKKIPLNEIKPIHVRQWQNSLTSYRDESGKPYSQTYLKCINNQLTAIFNYAVKYYGLKENPCHKAGSMGKKHADEMLSPLRKRRKASALSPFPTVFATVCRSICPIATGCKRTTGSFPTPRAFCITKWSMAARHRG